MRLGKEGLRALVKKHNLKIMIQERKPQENTSKSHKRAHPDAKPSGTHQELLKEVQEDQVNLREGRLSRQPRGKGNVSTTISGEDVDPSSYLRPVQRQSVCDAILRFFGFQ